MTSTTKIILTIVLSCLLGLYPNRETPAMPPEEIKNEDPPLHIDWINFIHIGDAVYLGFNGHGSSINLKGPDGKELYLAVRDKDLGEKIGHADYGPGEKNVPQNAIVSAYWAGKDIYAIKGIDKKYFIAAKTGEHGNSVFWRDFSRNPDEENQHNFSAEQKKVVALKSLLDKEIEQREAERQKHQDYLNANMWPWRIGFDGTTYTLEGSEVLSRFLGKTLGHITRNVNNNGAYPKNFKWRDGDSSYDMEGVSIRLIDGIDPRYYVAVWDKNFRSDSASVFYCDTRHNAKAEKAVRELIRQEK